MSNDKFEWTDSKVLEFALKVKTTGDAEWVMPQLEQFKQEQLSKRDWEIVSFTGFDGKKYHNPNGINSQIANGDVITSVRRLSDDSF